MRHLECRRCRDRYRIAKGGKHELKSALAGGREFLRPAKQAEAGSDEAARQDKKALQRRIETEVHMSLLVKIEVAHAAAPAGGTVCYALSVAPLPDRGSRR